MGRFNVVFASLLITASAGSAHGADKRACVEASDRAQSERSAGRLIEAKKSLVACSDPSCPGVVRAACAEWLDEVERALPSVVLSAKMLPRVCDKSSARDLTDVRVMLDGALFTEKLDGRAITIDPGKHTLVFDAEGTTAEAAVLIKEGEKSRSLAVELKDPTRCADAVEPRPPSPPTLDHGGPRASAFVFGAVSVAAFVTFGVFAGLGHSAYVDAENTCGTRCPDSVVDPISTKFIVADVALAAGIVAAGIATVLFLIPRAHGAPGQGSLATFHF